MKIVDRITFQAVGLSSVYATNISWFKIFSKGKALNDQRHLTTPPTIEWAYKELLRILAYIYIVSYINNVRVPRINGHSLTDGCR